MVTFLHEHQADGTARHGTGSGGRHGTGQRHGRAHGTAVSLRTSAEQMLAAAGPGALEAAGGPAGAETAAWQAAAVSVATLDRIEAAAAKLEADIAAAMAAQAQLHAARRSTLRSASSGL